jgi:hypothetical protein
MARPRPKPTFEGTLPPPERNPLALSVSALLHAVVILVVMLLSKLAERQADAKVDWPRRGGGDAYVRRQPQPVPPPPAPRQPAPTRPPERPAEVIKTRAEPNAPPRRLARTAEGTTRAPDPVGDPRSVPDATRQHR